MTKHSDKSNSDAFKLAAAHYIGQLKSSWKISVPGLLLTGIGTIFVIYIPPLLLAKLLGRFNGETTVAPSEIVPYVLLIGLFWLIGEALWRIAFHFLIKTEVASIKRLYAGAMEELLQKDVDFFNNNFAGALTRRVSAYGSNFVRFTDTLAFNVSPSVIPIIFVSVVLWQYSPWLVAGLLVMMGIAVAVALPLILKRARLVKKREDANTVLIGHVADTISNAPAVISFGKEDYELKIHRANTEDYANKVDKSFMFENLRIDILLSPIYVISNILGISIALLLGTSPLQIEAILVAFAYFAGVTRSMWEFNFIYRNIESSLTEAATFTELLLESPKIVDKPDANKLKVESGAISFDKVSFNYHENSEDGLFQDFDLHIQPGEKVGLVGHSGGGKTTITKLLLRFMDINDGEITVDGQNIANVTQKSLREVISYVPQEPLLFHRSLADNIRYAKDDATITEVKQAAKLAHAQEFIDELPEGYDTLVGERGVKLSGGQRQRVAIARAMIKDAPILLLDEATSALDSESERLIQDALWKLMEDKTTIVIAHRLSTIQKMDRIIVLDKGKIVEQGSHKELLANNGSYAKLWAHQSGGFLEE